MGLLNALGTAPFLILGIPIGVYVDRSPTVRVIAGSGLVRSGLLATIVLAWHLDVLTIWHLYLVATTAGTATVVTQTAQTAITPRIASAEGTARLVASMQSAEALIGLLIPAGAGLMVAALGAPPVLAIGTVVISLTALVITLGLAMYSALEAVLIARTLGLGSAGLGAIVSAGALGGLAAGAFAWGLVIVMYNVHSGAVTGRLTPPEAMGRVWAARRESSAR